MIDHRIWTRELELMESRVKQGDYKEFLKYFKLYLYGKYAKKDNLDMDDVTIHLSAHKELLKKKITELKLYSEKCSNSIIALQKAIDYAKEAITLSQDAGYAQVERLATKKIEEVNNIKKAIDKYSTTLGNTVDAANKMIVLLGKNIDDESVQKLINGVRVLDNVRDFNTTIIEYKSQFDNLLKNYVEKRVKIGDLPEKYSIVLHKMHNWLMFKVSPAKKLAFGIFIALLGMTIADPASNNSNASNNITSSNNSMAKAVVVNNAVSEIHKDKMLNVLSYGGKNYKIKGTLSGIATTYGAMFEGRKTFSGETFSHKKLNCAVPSGSSLYGKLIMIKSPKTGRSIIVKANDTGNFGYDKHGIPHKYSDQGKNEEERIIDLPQIAWVELGILDKHKLDPKMNIPLSDSVEISILEDY